MNSDLSDALEEETPQEILHPEDDHSLYSENPFGPVAVWIVIEVVQSAVGVLKTAIVYPKGLMTLKFYPVIVAKLNSREVIPNIIAEPVVWVSATTVQKVDLWL